MKKPLIWLSALVVLGLAYFASRMWPDKMPFAKTAEKAAVQKGFSRPTTAIVSTRDINFAITAAGEITPAEQVSVRPEISGRIDQLPVDIGDKVKKDAILFTLDDKDLQTEKAQRQIEIEGAKLQVVASQLTMEKIE